MLTRTALGLMMAVAFAAPALADATAAGRGVSDAFQKACSAGNIPEVMKLYEDDAIAIWPGQGEVANGKPAIEKMAADTCKPSGAELKLISQESKAIGRDYVLNIGRWESTAPEPDGKPMKVEVRTTELLHRSGGEWRYSVDHASIGLPPPPALAKTASK